MGLAPWSIGGPCPGRPGRGTWGAGASRSLPGRGPVAPPLAGGQWVGTGSRGSRVKKLCLRPEGCPSGQRQRALGLSLAAPKRGDLAWGRSPSRTRSGRQVAFKPRTIVKGAEKAACLPLGRDPEAGLPAAGGEAERQFNPMIWRVQRQKQGHFAAAKPRSGPVFIGLKRRRHSRRRLCQRQSGFPAGKPINHKSNHKSDFYDYF